METFRFKQFEVINERSAMKVGTDGVILGAAVTLESGDARILDAGTGTGVVALMIAQRSGDGTMITGIDIDPAAAEEAAANFRNCPWAERLAADNLPVQDCEGEFDLIVSNPPYFDESLTNPDPERTLARHTGTMSYRTLLDFAKDHLTADGRLSMILPTDRERDLMRYARMDGFFPFRILRIRTVARKEPMRMVVEFRRGRDNELREEELIIQEKGRYTVQYTDLVKDFYLWA